MMEAIERRCHQAGIEFRAKDAQMQCMPHTIHLAAIKVIFSICIAFYYNCKTTYNTFQLLEGIGLISKAESEQAASSNFTYQDEINTRVEREYDMEAAPEEEGVDDKIIPTDPSEKIKMAVQKVFFVVLVIFIELGSVRMA